MSLSQALSTALAGVNVTQQSLSVIAGNVANANTPGYVDETITAVEVAAGGSGGSGAAPAVTPLSIRTKVVVAPPPITPGPVVEPVVDEKNVGIFCAVFSVKFNV